jgi:hypothetical protein
MTGELCPDCRQLRAPHDQALSDFLAESPGTAVCWVNRDDYCQGGLLACLKAQLAKARADHQDVLALLGRGIQLMEGEEALRAQLAEAQRENEAWRALAGHVGTSASAGALSTERNGPTLTVELLCSRDVAGHGSTWAAAAIDLATKLNLITPKA